MKISGCMIVKNEEKLIRTSLESLNLICDEIIVIDTGSTDQTVEIAQEMKAEVYHFQWINDFSAAKNFAKEKASGDWIIFLDADEYFDQSHKIGQNIKRILKDIPRDFVAISCTIHNLNDENDVFSTHIANRIFRNSKEVRFEGSIHEDIRIDSKPVKAAPSKDLIIVHTGYQSASVKERNKGERNIELLKLALEKSPKDPHLYFYLGDAYGLMKDYLNQIIHYKKSIEAGPLNFLGFEPYEREVCIARAVAHSSLSGEVKEYEMSKIHKKYPEVFLVNLYYGMCYYDMRRYQDALVMLDKAMTLTKEASGMELVTKKKQYRMVYKYRGLIHKALYNKKLAMENVVSALIMDRENDTEDLYMITQLSHLLLGEEAVVAIGIINSIWKCLTPDVCKNLINVFLQSGNVVLTNYFIKKLYEMTGVKPTGIAFSQLYMGNLEGAVSTALEVYSETGDKEFLSVVFCALYVQNKLDELMTLSENQGLDIEPYDKFIGLIKGEDLKEVPSQHIYGVIVKLFHMGKEEAAKDFIVKLPKDFKDINFYRTVTNTLKDYGYESAALGFVADNIISLGFVEKGIAYSVLSDLNCVLENYPQAVEMAEMAVDRWQLDNIVLERLVAVINKMADNERRRINDLIAAVPGKNYLMKYI